MGFHRCTRVRLQWGNGDASLGTLRTFDAIALPAELSSTHQSFRVEAEETVCTMLWRDGSFQKVLGREEITMLPVVVEEKKELAEWLLAYPSYRVPSAQWITLLIVLQSFVMFYCVFGVI